MPRERNGVRILKLAAAAFVVAVLAVEIILVAPHLANAGRSLRHPHLGWVLVALIAEAASMAMFARLQRRMLTAGGVRIPILRMMGLTYAANAMSVTLPAGQVASSAYIFRKLRAWGAGGPLVTFGLLASGALSTITLTVILVLGATLAGRGQGSPALLVVEVIAAIIGAIGLQRLMRRPDLMLRLGRYGTTWFDRVLRRPLDAGQDRVRAVIQEFTLIRPRTRDWLIGLLLAALNWTYDLVCLVAACRAVGAHGPSVELALVTYAAAMTASSVPLLPGGLGVVDGVLILALVRGGFTAGTATAGVIVYRVISLGLVALVGWLLWVVVDRVGRRVNA